MCGWTAPSRQAIDLCALLLQESPGVTAPSAACTYTYCAEAGSPLQGAYNTPEIDEGPDLRA
jgi:hypothetical protein